MQPVTTQFRCLVPASDVGHVIGRKGETVQSLRDRSGATIKVHEGNSGDGLPIRLCALLGVRPVCQPQQSAHMRQPS